VTDRSARGVILAVSAALVAAVFAVDLAERSGGAFWSDGATYYTMSWSLAEDGDLRYQPRDLARVKREFPSGPQGIFMKRSSGGLALQRGFPWLRRVGPDEPRIYFAKSFAYPLVAAPLVALFGTPGLLLANALSLGVALWFGYGLARRRAPPGRALAWTLVLFFATVTPVYLVWPQPELLNVGLITAGLAAWASGRPLLAALLLGVATYSKPTNLFLALPLGVEPLLPRSDRSFWRGLGESLRRGAVLAAVVVGFYGLNAVVTGEINYQGGERKTFYDRFPGELVVGPDGPREITFGNSGFWMTTNQVGPLVEGRDEDKVSMGSGPPLSAEELRGAFLANLGYFWVGRYGGAVAYFFPVVAALLLFLAAGPRTVEGWLGVASLVVSWLFYIWLIPANWYGGGGTVGNRYFLNLVPLGLLLLPRGREWLAVAGGALVGAVLLGPVLARPFWHSLHPGRHAIRAPYRVFPAELTMLNDLSFCIDSWRCKQPVGDVLGDPWRGWPPDPRAYYLYFPDDGSVAGREDVGREGGLRVRRGERAEVILRALEPVAKLHVRVEGGHGPLEVCVDGECRELVPQPEAPAESSFEPARGLLYYDTFLHVLHLRSREETAAGPGPDDGPAVSIALEVERRSR
jgi:hypothetical protein